MDIVLGALLAITGVSAAYIAGKFFDSRVKTKRIEAVTTEKKQSKTNFADYVEQVPFIHQQTVEIYNQQFQNCIKTQKMTDEEARAVLKPLEDKIKLLETIQKLPEPVVKFGANLMDKGANKIISVIEDI